MTRTQKVITGFLVAAGSILAINQALTQPDRVALAAEPFSLQSLACETETGVVVLSVIMPNSYTFQELDMEAERVCDSMQYADTTYPRGTDAVCDTDMNCAYFDEYSEFGITGVFVDHDDNSGMRWLKATCEDGSEHVIDDPSELGVICQ